MTDYGITAEGYVIKPLPIIESEIEASMKAIFGDQINTTPQSIFGQLKGIYSEREFKLWELNEDIYNAGYRPTATGASLDNVNSLVNADRLEALKSQITGQALFGILGTLISTGTIFSVDGSPSIKFTSLLDVTLIAGTDEVQTLTFSSGTPTGGSFQLTFGVETSAVIQWDDGATEIQTALNNLTTLSGVTVTGSYAAGFVVTFAGVDGKQPQTDLSETNNSLVDGVTPITITVTETILGVYQGTVNCEATDDGIISANAKTLTVIDTPVNGLDSTFNPLATNVGRSLEEDPAYRLRGSQETQISRAGTAGAIEAAILDLNEDTTLAEILSAVVFENDTNTVDAAGRPAKSFEANVYQDGNSTERDQEIAQAVFDAKPGGIESFGSISKTVTDSQGFNKTVYFSRADEIDIYLELDLTVTSDYPTDGDTQVKALMKAFGDALGVGQDVVVYPALVGELNAIAGITDVVIRIGIAPGPTLDDNIVIDDGTLGSVEISVWDLTRITVTS